MIKNYMMDVLDHINFGYKAPEGYVAGDKDCGYRSALRHLGINQSLHTDCIATSVIYQREAPREEIQIDMFGGVK